MLACGEAISAAVFAELLTSWGAVAQAMTGAQAGILTDDRYGDARILDVDPRHLTAAIDRGLDGHGYIRPGLGDAGDRLFGTR